MAFRAEPVEGASHVDFLLGAHVEECQVDGGAACVSAFFHDVFLLEEDTFVEVGVEIGLHGCVGEVCCPANEMVYGALWAIGVVYLQAVAESHEVVADSAQAVGGDARKEGCRLLIAVDARAYEVVCAEVSYLEYCVGYGVSQGNELAIVLQGVGLHFGLAAACYKKHAEDENGDYFFHGGEGVGGF